MNQNGSSDRDVAAHARGTSTGMDESSRKAKALRERQSALEFKISHVLTSLFLLWLLMVHILGILFFGKGFLLARLVLDNKSQCSTLPDGSESRVQDGCWHPRTFDKAVIILIDALRYDFTVPFRPTTDQPSPRAYHNAFPFLHDTARSRPTHAFLLPFIADPPTTTLQRLKALTTGSLPTFIEAGTNFAGSAIEEDNLIAQLNEAGKTVVHLGDDTWHALFPGYFDANWTHAYDSFDVRDLHTVDNGVIQHIFPLLDSREAKWDIAIGHFLGVDHAGHRYGPEHAAMTEKLNQMNDVVSRIADVIDEKTLLVVMGDHGMDPKGDHGGESDDEVEAALWMYSKTPRFGRLHSAFVEPPETAKERPVRQIDLVPTLALLLGVPIPFNNLGSPIDEAFTGVGSIDWPNLVTVNQLNLQQMENFQTEYSKIKMLDRNPAQFQRRQALEQLRGSRKWQSIYQASKAWQHETLNMYRKLWANFVVEDMVHGLEILCGSFVVLLLVAAGVRKGLVIQLPTMLRHIGAGLGGGLVFGPVLTWVFPDHLSAVFGMAYGLAVGAIITMSIALYQRRKVMSWPWPRSAWAWMAAAFTILQSAGFAANSFTIHEDTILLLFLTTFGVVALLSSQRQSSNSDRVLGTYHSILFLIHTRLASVSRMCREEQMPGCRTTLYASSNSSTAAPWQLFIPYVVALVLPEIIKAFYKGTASYEGSAGFWIGFCFRIGLLLVAIIWTVDAAENGRWLSDVLSKDSLETIRIGLARGVLAIAIPTGLATYIWAKPCVNVFLTHPTAAAAPEPPRPQLTILGYANAHGARYYLILPIFILLTALILPPMGQFSLALLSWQMLSLFEILDTNGLIISSPSAASPIGPVMLAMMGSYHFFKTGHQATLASIQWNVPFLVLRGVSYVWSPLLIILNTFGTQILCALAVPLTVLWKRPITPSGVKGVMGLVLKAMLYHVLYYATVAVATTMWAGHLRRHLMLYRVFMPRYLMASAVLLIVDVVLVVLALPAVRVSGCSVGEVFGF